jgi:isocitrate dehydrogenase
MTKAGIIDLLKNAVSENIDAIKTENLYEFDGKAGYSLGQGQ